MSESLLGEHSRPTEEVLACIADRKCRIVLSILQKQTTPVSTAELATRAVATLTEESLVDVTREARDDFHSSLYHNHLPRLTEADLIEWSPGEGTVATSDHAVLRNEQVQRMIEVDAEGWDQVLRAIAATRRRIALSIIESADSIDRDILAQRVVDRENESSSIQDSGQEPEEVLAALHHVHLPKLQQAGLIVYDNETARYAGHEALDPAWLELGPGEVVADDPDPVDGMEGMWTLEGAEDIVVRGQSLFEQADDELFLMITTDGLLEDGCITRLEDAIDRGVDVYLGSQSSAVRDLVRQRLPDVVIWEPQRNWMNLPPEREKVGRLVLADREAVLVGTLGEELDDGYEEMAITGEGEDTALVVLLRELLGDRVDHLDEQSTDFLSQLPL